MAKNVTKIKADLLKNESPEELKEICSAKQSADKDKRMLRIDERTYVLVRADKCTPEYAVRVRARLEKNREKYY